MDRRKFTQGFALLAGGAMLHNLVGAGGAQVASWLLQSPQDFSRDYFVARIGQRFGLSQDPTHTMILRSVDAAGRVPSREQFHVVFEREAGAPFEEGIFRLQGENLEEFELFLSPGETRGGRQRLLATFSLLPLA